MKEVFMKWEGLVAVKTDGDLDAVRDELQRALDRTLPLRDGQIEVTLLSRAPKKWQNKRPKRVGKERIE